MEEIIFDVLIVGAGPAGAACALALRRYSEQQVLVIDSGDLQQVRVGEHVSASVFDFFDYLQVDRAQFSEQCFSANYGSTSYWGSSHANTHDSLFTTAGDSYQLQREEFDLALLAQVAEAGGHVLPRSRCLGFEQDANHRWHVTINHPDRGRLQIQASYLVDASGRTSAISRQLGIKREKTDNLVAVGAYLELPEDMAHNQLIEACELGWWYSARIGEKRVVAIFFSDADIISQHQLQQTAHWNHLLAKTRYMRRRLHKGISHVAKLWIKPANSQISQLHKTRHFLAIGDAAAAFDPISSMGLGFALTSACHGAKAIRRAKAEGNDRPIDVYSHDIRNNFANYKITHQQVYRQEQRFSSEVFWQRRCGLSGSLEVPFLVS